ncbi:hypothetical protein Pfo_011106 [Paulownia fortunei]|nr:hypothetical protein Pfo_011106 [Paulownia fortunei]
MKIHFKSLLSQLTKPNQTLSRTRILHALIIKNRLSFDPFYATRILRFYAINNDLISARNLFDRTPQRSVFLWNSIIRAYAQAHEFLDAFVLFKRLLGSETQPDNYTFACVARACVDRFDVEALRLVHGKVVAFGLGLDFVCNSALVSCYSKLGLVDEASCVFRGIHEPDLVLWNAMISGYGSCEDWMKGIELFNAMQNIGMRPDGYTVVGLIIGLTDHRLINAGDHVKALELFRELLMAGGRADPVLLASVLAASAHLAIVGPGCEIHGYAVRHECNTEVAVSSALIDMYAKCGFLEMGIKVFKNMPKRNVVSYNTVISSLGLYGRAPDAFKMFEEILEEGVKPDETTFAGLLSACCHSGLVNDGRGYFRMMTKEFGIQAKTEHHVHMVKLLGMDGKLEEAYDLIRSLPEPVNSGIWGALLSCCDSHKNYELLEVIAKHLFENEPKNSSYSVMLSNLFAGDGRWNDVKQLRVDTGGAKGKMPGISWISDINH